MKPFKISPPSHVGYTSFLRLSCQSNLSTAPLQCWANRSDNQAKACALNKRTAWSLFYRNNWGSKDQASLTFQVVVFMLVSVSIALGPLFPCFTEQGVGADSSLPVLPYLWPAWPLWAFGCVPLGRGWGSHSEVKLAMFHRPICG